MPAAAQVTNSWSTRLWTGPRFCEAFGIDPDKVRRIIIDMNADDPIIAVYVQMIGDENDLDVVLDAFERVAESTAEG